MRKSPMRHRHILFAALFAALLSCAAAQQPVRAVPQPVPQDVAADVTALFIAISTGQFHAPVGNMFSAPVVIDPNHPIPMARITDSLIGPNQPCVAPTQPDPNYKPTDTADYWGHVLGDRHIDYPKSSQPLYDELMANYVALCHSKWTLPPTVEGHNIPVPDGDHDYGSISPVVFNSSHTFAIVFFCINSGPLADKGMWLAFERSGATPGSGWTQNMNWGNSVVMHD